MKETCICVSVCVHQGFLYLLLYLSQLCGPRGTPSLSALMCDCCALHRPVLFSSLSGSAQRVPWVLGPSTLSLLSPYYLILLHMMCSHLSLSLSLVFSTHPFSLLPVELEQSCLSKNECGYRIVMRCRIIIFFLSLVFF